jgi:serine/threonine protein kinase
LEHGARVASPSTRRGRAELNPERWQQISRIFKSAISLDDAARAAYVKEKCGTDADLREEVERLIESHQQAVSNDFIGGHAVENAADLFVGEEEELSLEKGQHFGSYVILDHLGTGGMGQVYRAQDSRLDRTVALKILSPDVAADKRRMQRFRQEAKVASSLNHPNIVTIFEFGEVDNLTYLSTEFVDGETLRDWLRGKRLKLAEILDIAIQMLAALDAAHEAKIIHRDMKPENVMIRRRDHVVKVLDFGLAKLIEKRETLADLTSEPEAPTELRTTPGLIMGTVNYMSPEQARARAVDTRSDIWSVGLMIYEMVVGTKPFGGPTSAHTIVEILEKEPPSLVEVGPSGMPEDLQRIVAKSLAKTPDERYQTSKDMMLDLSNLKKRLETQLITPEEPKSSQRWIVALLITVGLLAGVFAVNTWRNRQVAPVVEPPQAVAPAPVERILTYWITVQKFKNDKPYQRPFDISGEINFEAGYRIRLNISSPQAGYLYVLNEGPIQTGGAREFIAVFPSSTSNAGSEVVAANQTVKIPDPSWLRFDEEQGVEKLWLVFSERAVPELESIKNFASAETAGLITDSQLTKTINSFLDSHSTVQVTAEKGETVTTLKAPKDILVYAVRLEHH